MNRPDRFAASRIWPWNRLYELKNLSPYQREAIWGECRRSSGCAPRGCLLVVLVVVLGVLASVSVTVYYTRDGGQVPYAVDFFFYGLSAVIGGLVANAILRRTQMAVRARMMEVYRGRRFPHCLHCGYALTGLPDDQATCPECGGAVQGEDAIPQAPR